MVCFIPWVQTRETHMSLEKGTCKLGETEDPAYTCHTIKDD